MEFKDVHGKVDIVVDALQCLGQDKEEIMGRASTALNEIWNAYREADMGSDMFDELSTELKGLTGTRCLGDAMRLVQSKFKKGNFFKKYIVENIKWVATILLVVFILSTMGSLFLLAIGLISLMEYSFKAGKWFKHFVEEVHSHIW